MKQADTATETVRGFTLIQGGLPVSAFGITAILTPTLLVVCPTKNVADEKTGTELILGMVNMEPGKQFDTFMEFWTAIEKEMNTPAYMASRIIAESVDEWGNPKQAAGNVVSIDVGKQGTRNG